MPGLVKVGEWRGGRSCQLSQGRVRESLRGLTRIPPIQGQYKPSRKGAKTRAPLSECYSVQS